MSIPWTDRIIVTPRTGEGAYGALYGAAVTYKARLEKDYSFDIAEITVP